MDKSLKTVKKASILDTYIAIARVRMVLGDFNIAEEMLNRGEELLSVVPDKDMQLIEILLIRGIINRETGELDKAYDFLNRSADLARQKGLFPTRQLQARSQIGLFKRGL